MSNVTNVKTYPALPFCEGEILRYAGCRAQNGAPDSTVTELLHACEAMVQLTYRVCWQLLPVTIEGDVTHLGEMTLPSKNLAKVLAPCAKAVVFAGTIGVAIDRLVSRYSHISPAKALMLQALGAAQIEALCDVFCADIEKETGLFGVPRFSPGYGDLSLETQKEFFTHLGCEKRIGLTLNDSLLMSPTKSVTAILGLTDVAQENHGNKCARCGNRNCAYRENIHL